MLWSPVRIVPAVLLVLVTLFAATALAADPSQPWLQDEEPIFLVLPHVITNDELVDAPLSKFSECVSLDTSIPDLFSGVLFTRILIPSAGVGSTPICLTIPNLVGLI